MGNKSSNNNGPRLGLVGPDRPWYWAGYVFADAALNEYLIKKIALLRADHIFVDIMEPDLLPMEIYVQIFLHLDLKTLCIIIPLVCKSFFNAASGNSIVWQIKAKEKPPGQKKRQKQTWKQFCFVENIKLFPVLGLELGSSMEEVKSKHPNAQITVSDPVRGTYEVIIDGKYTICLFPVYQKVIFSLVSIASPPYWGICPNMSQIPEEWQAQGLTADKSFNEYKLFIARWTQNFTARVQDQMGELIVHARSDDEDEGCLYTMTLTFYFTRGRVLGNEDTPDTLGTMHVGHCINLKRCRKKGHYRFHFE